VLPIGIMVMPAPGAIGGAKAAAGGMTATGGDGRAGVDPGIWQSILKNPSSHHVLNCGSNQVFKFID